MKASKGRCVRRNQESPSAQTPSMGGGASSRAVPSSSTSAGHFMEPPAGTWEHAAPEAASPPGRAPSSSQPDQSQALATSNGKWTEESPVQKPLYSVSQRIENGLACLSKNTSALPATSRRGQTTHPEPLQTRGQMDLWTAMGTGPMCRAALAGAPVPVVAATFGYGQHPNSVRAPTTHAKGPEELELTKTSFLQLETKQVCVPQNNKTITLDLSLQDKNLQTACNTSVWVLI